MNTPTLPDVTGTYAEAIRQRLELRPSLALTVAELCKDLDLSDRLVRMGLDRLVFTNAVTVGFRHRAHKRGSTPREYRLSR